MVVILTTTKVLKTPGRGDGVKDGECLFKSEQTENQKLSTNVYTSSRITIVNLSIRFKIQRTLKVGKNWMNKSIYIDGHRPPRANDEDVDLHSLEFSSSEVSDDSSTDS